MFECSEYWSLADYLPLDRIADYWCAKTGYKDSHCKDAKKSAIVSACSNGIIRYARSDGKDFQDPPQSLASRNILLIERASFDAWVLDQFGDTSPLPPKPLSTVERDSLLLIIEALSKEAGIETQARGASVKIRELIQLTGADLDEDTIRRFIKQIPDALDRRIK